MKEIWLWLLLGWLAAANAAGFFLMGWDKRQARRGGWRVRERTLLLTAALGGSLGSILGMRHFRHKTKHWYFRWGLPAILALQAGLALWLVLGKR